MSEEGGGASRSTDPAAGSSAATDVSLREHVEMQIRYEHDLTDQAINYERRMTDRENELRAMALAIKEEADKAALELDRQIRAYKDEKQNEFRGALDDLSQQMATRRELSDAKDQIATVIKPLADYVSSQQGRSAGIGVSANVVATLVGIMLVIAGLALTVYLSRH